MLAHQHACGVYQNARPPMNEIYAMFAGKASTGDVMLAAETTPGSPAERKLALFYAHLYVGLIEEAAGKTDSSKSHIESAAKGFDEPNYMGDVARIHLKALNPTTKPVEK